MKLDRDFIWAAQRTAELSVPWWRWKKRRKAVAEMRVRIWNMVVADVTRDVVAGLGRSNRGSTWVTFDDVERYIKSRSKE